MLPGRGSGRGRGEAGRQVTRVEAGSTGGEVGGAGPEVDSEKSSTGIYDGYQVPHEDRASTGGSGYEDAVSNPAASGTSQGHEKDIRESDPMQEPGTGGSGYEQDSDMFKQHEELGGSRFPGDKAIPQ